MQKYELQLPLCQLIFLLLLYFLCPEKFSPLSTQLLFQPNVYYKRKKMNKTKTESGGGVEIRVTLIYLAWFHCHHPWRAGVVGDFLPSGNSFRTQGWWFLAFPWKPVSQLQSEGIWQKQSGVPGANPRRLSVTLDKSVFPFPGYLPPWREFSKDFSRKQVKQEDSDHREGKCSFSK